MSRKILQDQDYNNQSRILNLLPPGSANEPARLADLNSAVEGLGWKDSVRVASTANINLAAPGATIDGATMSAGQRFLGKNQTAPAENGIYDWNGAATPATRALDASTALELEQAIVTVEEGTSAGASFRQTSVNFTLDSDAVAWTTFGTAAPAATETVSGMAELATQVETDTGTDDARTVTPLKLANHAGRVRKATGTVGDGAATQIDITHNFNTRNVNVTVWRNATPWDNVGEGIDIERPDANTVRLRFSAAPTAAQFAYIIMA